jgi:hypothetical protein
MPLLQETELCSVSCKKKDFVASVVCSWFGQKLGNADNMLAILPKG